MRLQDHEYNRLTVLKKLRAAEPVARTELARLSGLKGSTITAIVGDLVARDMVREEKVASGSPGRPRINLSLNPAGAFVAAATLSLDGRLIGEIVDMRGTCVHSFARATRFTPKLDELAQQFAETLAEAIAASAAKGAPVTSVGIGLPAILDTRSGVVEYLATYEAGPFPFARFVEDRLGVSVWVDNTNNLLARAEHWFGDGTGIDDFTLVLLDLGLGAARYRHGQLLIGSHGLEAELGHTKIVPLTGRRCHCGARGCLQVYSSLSGILAQCHEILDRPLPDYLEMRPAVAELLSGPAAQEPAIAAIIAQAAHYLGVGLANHVNMDDPERIIILSSVPALLPLIEARTLAALWENTLPVLRDRTRVTFKTTDGHAFSRGAAAMVLEQLYQRPG